MEKRTGRIVRLIGFEAVIPEVVFSVDIRADDGKESILHTNSLTLQQMLVTAYATQRKVEVLCHPMQAEAAEILRKHVISLGGGKADVDGPFTVRAVSTLE